MLNKGRLNITTDVCRLMSTERCHDNTPTSHRTASNQLPVGVLSSASPEFGCAPGGSDSFWAVRGGGGQVGGTVGQSKRERQVWTMCASYIVNRLDGAAVLQMRTHGVEELKDALTCVPAIHCTTM